MILADWRPDVRRKPHHASGFHVSRETQAGTPKYGFQRREQHGKLALQTPTIQPSIVPGGRLQ